LYVNSMTSYVPNDLIHILQSLLHIKPVTDFRDPSLPFPSLSTCPNFRLYFTINLASPLAHCIPWHSFRSFNCNLFNHSFFGPSRFWTAAWLTLIYFLFPPLIFLL
jgi:hypothetical protein